MLKALIKDLSEVNETERAFYKKVEHGYIVEVESVDGYDLQNVAPLKSAFERQKADYDAAKKVLKSFGSLDPKETLKKLERYDKLKDLNPEQLAKEKVRTALDAQQVEFTQQVETLQGQINQRNNTIQSSALNEVYTAIAKQNGTPEFAKSYIEKICKVDINDDGSTQLKILNDDGQTERTLIEDGKIMPYNINNLVNDLQKHEVYGKMFASTATSGSGGETNYNQSQHENVLKVSSQDAHKHFDGIRKGTVIVE